MTIETMNAELKYFLSEGPYSVADLSRVTGRSQTWVRDNLKKFQDVVLCKKNETGSNVFWLPTETGGGEIVAPDPAEVEETKPMETPPAETPAPLPTPEPVVEGVVEDTETHDDFLLQTKEEGDEAPEDVDGCPLCASTADQVPAGEPGSFLGACLTCPDCGKTYNAINGKEVTAMAEAKAAKGKRKPLNPQYKIRARVEAAEKAGGSLKFDRTDRRWVLETKSGDTVSFTAEQFARETAETITAKVG